MILTQEALKKIKDKRIRQALGSEDCLDVIDQVINKYIKDNKPNGPLTTYIALKVIREKTGLSDNEILIDEKAVAAKLYSKSASTA
jgi:hypothetical protein